MELNKNIIFIKYRDFIKNDFYKLNKDAIYKLDKKEDVLDDFTNYKKYFVKYELKKNDPIISKKQLEYWKTNLITPREIKYRQKSEELIIN